MKVRRYAIWKHFPDEAKREVLKHQFTSTDRDGVNPRDEDCYCPLGRAIQAIHPDWEGRLPGSKETLAVLGKTSARIARSALVFIYDWDDGKIPPERLAEAMGVEP